MVEIAAGATALGVALGGASFAAGLGAAAIDGSACVGSEHDKAACVGAILGATGVIAGGAATGGALWAEEGSLIDAILQGVGAFGALFGISGSILDSLLAALPLTSTDNSSWDNPNCA